MTTEQKTCKTCGEPEMLGLPDSGQFGWWSYTDDRGKWRTVCQRCGADPTRKARKA